MLEWLQSALGVASASFVAIIALGFGAMFVFFSGASALVLGQFIPFAAAPRHAALAVGAAALLWALFAPASLDGDLAVLLQSIRSDALRDGLELLIRYSWVLAQLVCSAIAYPIYRRRARYPWLLRALGTGLLACGLLYAASLLAPALLPLRGLALLGAVLLLEVPLLGLFPLTVLGLVEHVRQRPVEWFISLRYLVAKRRQTFISIISVICVLGVALGVAVITVVLSVMNGFSAVWEEKIIGTRAHFVLQSRFGLFEEYAALREQVSAIPGVVGATPYLETEAIVRLGGGELQAILLKGIDPATVGQATKLPQDLREGSLDDLDARPDAAGNERYPGIVLGRELADRYGLKIGEPVVLIAPMGGANTPHGPAPRLARFRLAGIFQSDFYEFDERYAYGSLAGVQDFMRIDDKAAGIEVRTADLYRSAAVLARVLDTVGGDFWGRDWKQFYPGFFSALRTERVMMFVLLSFIMVVAGFIIIATLIMMIMEKSRDIAILKAMGCEDDGILRVFAIEGFLIGVGGTLTGLGMGLVITWNLGGIQAVVEQLLGIDVLPANVYQLQELPYSVIPWELGVISLIALVLAIGATLLPSWQAARIDPAEALRYE
jgi:lipoprotein-releasing system permease protein